MKREYWAVWAGPLVVFLAACGGTSRTPGMDSPRAGAAATAGGAAVEQGGQAGSAAGSAAGTRTLGGSPAEDLGGAGGAAAGGAGNACSTVDLEGLNVFNSGQWDPLGYPPYALEGCKLVYVAPADGGGALHLRDLSTGDDLELEPAASQPRRPALSGDVIAWEIVDNTKSQVRVSYQGKVQTLTGDFDHAGEPRVAADAVVFTAFLGPNPTDDTDVYLYSVADDELSPVAVGAGQQRFADVSLTHVAATDFSEDPRGYFNQSDSIADLLIIDRKSGLATPRKRDGKQAFPLLGGDEALVYLDWGSVHPEPKFSQFGLRAGVLGAPLADYDVKLEVYTKVPYLRPSLHGQNIDFVDTINDVLGLYRFTIGSQQPPTAVPIVGSPQLFGPVAADAMTLIAKPLQGQTLALTAVAR